MVLIDATNSSPTIQFAQAIRPHRLGILVGQPAGGSQRGINGGAFLFLRLPHSGIEMDRPPIGTLPSRPETDAGLTPDIVVNRTPSNVAHKRDLERAAVAELLSNSSAELVDYGGKRALVFLKFGADSDWSPESFHLGGYFEVQETQDITDASHTSAASQA